MHRLLVFPSILLWNSYFFFDMRKGTSQNFQHLNYYKTQKNYTEGAELDNFVQWHALAAAILHPNDVWFQILPPIRKNGNSVP